MLLFSESSFRYLIKLELKVQSLIEACELNVGAHAALVVRGCLRRPTLKKMVSVVILGGGGAIVNTVAAMILIEIFLKLKQVVEQ